MSRRMRSVAGIGCAILTVLGLVYVLFWPASAPPRTPIAWKLQPDGLPVGTVLQGSRLEMSLGLFSGLKPAPIPTVLSSLPSPLSKAAVWMLEQFRTTVAKMGLRVRVEAPAFVEIEQIEVGLHSSQGPFVVVSFRVKTDRPGDWQSNLVIHVTGNAYGTTNYRAILLGGAQMARLGPVQEGQVRKFVAG